MIGLTNPIQAPKSGNVELAAEGTLVLNRPTEQDINSGTT